MKRYVKIHNFKEIHLKDKRNWGKRKENKNTYVGTGSPSASHSIRNGLSFSLIFFWLTWNNCSSVGGCLDIRGGDWTNKTSNLLDLQWYKHQVEVELVKETYNVNGEKKRKNGRCIYKTFDVTNLLHDGWFKWFSALSFFTELKDQWLCYKLI